MNMLRLLPFLPYGHRPQKAPSAAFHARMVVSESAYEEMRRHLLQDDGMERVLFCHVNTARDNDGGIKTFYVRGVYCVPDGGYKRQERAFVSLTTATLLKHFRAYADSDDEGLMHFHSHPFACSGEFSPVDLRTMEMTCRGLKDYFIASQVGKPASFGMVVVGREEAGFSSVIMDGATGNQVVISEMQIEGKNGRRTIRKGKSRLSDSVVLDHDLLDRNIKWLGSEGQQKLSEQHVVLLGLGGVGSQVALQLRGLGLKKITLLDGDKIEKSNLNRLAGATASDIGSCKVHVAKRMIDDVGGHTEVVAIPEHFNMNEKSAWEVVSEADIIIAAVDGVKTRFDIQLLAARYLKPYLDLGSGIHVDSGTGSVKRIAGQVVFYYPGGPCLCCQTVVPRDIESDLSLAVKKATGYVSGTDFTPTSVVTVNSIIAGHAVDQMIRYLTGFSAVNTYLHCDLLNTVHRVYDFPKKRSCLICGDEGIEGAGGNFTEPMIQDSVSTSNDDILDIGGLEQVVITP